MHCTFFGQTYYRKISNSTWNLLGLKRASTCKPSERIKQINSGHKTFKSLLFPQIASRSKNLIPRMTETLCFCHLVSPWHLSKEDLCGALHHITTKVTRDDGVTTKGKDVKPANTMQRPSILRRDEKNRFSDKFFGHLKRSRVQTK